MKNAQDAFDKSWKQRPETAYNHWTPGSPENQIQFAFRRHWLLFKKLTQAVPARTCLETGCGRGSISSYFADAGFDCTLLDYSQAVLDTAAAVFRTNGHKARFVCGDANRLPFPDCSFSVAVSIGLLEHFEDIATPLHEQIRILEPGGVLLAYIVPERTSPVQQVFNGVNAALKSIHRIAGGEEKQQAKQDIFRSEYNSKVYLDALCGLPVEDIRVLGMYPVPMISHSPEFPFTLMPPPAEKLLVGAFDAVMAARSVLHPDDDPWTCAESEGQAFLLTCRKSV